jgi:hypothetical protein
MEASGENLLRGSGWFRYVTGDGSVGRVPIEGGNPTTRATGQAGRSTKSGVLKTLGTPRDVHRVPVAPRDLVQ